MNWINLNIRGRSGLTQNIKYLGVLPSNERVLLDGTHQGIYHYNLLFEKMVESEILVGEETGAAKAKRDEFICPARNEKPKPHLPWLFELQLLTFCGFNEESRVTRRRDFF